MAGVIKGIPPLLVKTEYLKHIHEQCMTYLISLCCASSQTHFFCNHRNAGRETKTFSFFSIIFINHLLTCPTNLTICSVVLLPWLALLSYIKLKLPGQTNFTPAAKLHLGKALNICLKERKVTGTLQPLSLPN